MKKFKVFGIFTLLILLLISCENHHNSPHERIRESVGQSAPEKFNVQKYKTINDFTSYDDFVVYDINRLKKPVILIGKSKTMGLYGIVLIDGNDSIRRYDNMSSLANAIGESRQVGDTIK